MHTLGRHIDVEHRRIGVKFVVSSIRLCRVAAWATRGWTPAIEVLKYMATPGASFDS
jgi:hypothetical protein